MTGEEIKNAFTENPDLQKEVLEGFKESHVIRSKEEDDSWRTGFEQDLVSKKTREIATAVEEDIFNASGIEKEEGEKYYDYNKRVVSYLKERADKSKKLESKLEEAINSKGDETLKKELDQYKARIEEMTNAHKDEMTTVKTQFETSQKKGVISASAKGMAFGDFPEDVVNTMLSSAESELLNTPSAMLDGELVFLDDNGDVMKDKESFKNITATDLLRGKLGSILKVEGQTAKGVGTSAPATKPSAIAPADVKTKIQLDRYLIEQGVPKGTAEYSEKFAELGGNDLPLR